ncbi:hydrolase [Fictibacillus sp. Mic-4]|uniref:hydrolase n=1 Tax=Fictibacillus sp. Mic-4 TaxID=3132826 RepID=UPI003CF735AF
MMNPIHFNPETTAVIAIDLQKGIVNLKGRPYTGNSVILQSTKLIEGFRKKGALIVYVRVDFIDSKDALKPLTDQNMAQANRPKDWAELVPELDVQPGDLIITKRQWGAFFGTELDLQLRRRGIDTIVLCGIATNIGVETTAREAFQYGYQQVFAADAMTAFSEEEHNHSIQYIFSRIGRNRTTKEILDDLK